MIVNVCITPIQRAIISLFRKKSISNEESTLFFEMSVFKANKGCEMQLGASIWHVDDIIVV